MLWEKYVPSRFYQFISQIKSFMQMNGLQVQVFHPGVTGIVMLYVKSICQKILRNSQLVSISISKSTNLFPACFSPRFLCKIKSAVLILALSLCFTSKTGQIRTANSAKIYVARGEKDFNEFGQKTINPDVQKNFKSSALKIKNTHQRLLAKKNTNANLKAEHAEKLKSNLKA